VPDGDGTYRVDRTTFTAKIGRDGRIDFTDKPNLSIGVQLPTQKQVGKALERWYSDPYGWSTVPPPAAVVGVGGAFDLTDAYMRANGEDPYRYEKMLVSRATAAARDQMAADERARLRRDGLAELRARLHAIWRSPAPAPARRARLFALWDEMAEDGELAQAGAAARAVVLRFIRAHVADGYPPPELDALNARRRSRARFVP